MPSYRTLVESLLQTMQTNLHNRPARDINPDDWPWPLRLVIMLFTYLSIAAPAYFLILYIRRRDSAGHWNPTSRIAQLISGFAIGDPAYTPLPTDIPKEKRDLSEESHSFWKDFLDFLYCFTGIMSTLLMMGVLQERIITHDYSRIADPVQKDNFRDMQFLVFCNRLFALFTALFMMKFILPNQPPHAKPYYVHAKTSFANTMSSWCQYEALKFVSFPVQTICKVSKVVSTMAMAKIVRNHKYSCTEYGTAFGIALGAGLFMLNTGEHGHVETATSVSGLFLMFGYLVFDSYTLNYQKSLLDSHPKPSKYQMMLGTNTFSVIITLVSLLEQGTLWSSLEFAFSHHDFLLHNTLMSLCAAFSQVFIYSTIERFGPVVFSILMTVRQIGSILISTIVYAHPFTVWSGVGLLACFGFIFFDIYRNYKSRGRR